MWKGNYTTRKWKHNQNQDYKWKPQIPEYRKEDEDGNVEFVYVLWEDIPYKFKVGLPQYVGHNNIREIDGKECIDAQLWNAWVKYLDVNSKDWLTKGRGKNSDIPHTKEELQQIILGQ